MLLQLWLFVVAVVVVCVICALALHWEMEAMEKANYLEELAKKDLKRVDPRFIEAKRRRCIYARRNTLLPISDCKELEEWQCWQIASFEDAKKDCMKPEIYENYEPWFLGKKPNE